MTMQQIVRVFVGAIALSLATGVPYSNFLMAQEAPVEGKAQAVAATIEAVFAATEAADYAALDTLFAGDSLTIIEGAGIDRGWSDYRDHHLRPELDAFRSLLYRPYEIEAHVFQERAWAIFRFDLKIDLENRTVDNVGRGTAILERRGGRWVLRHMQTTSRPRR